MNSKVLLIIMLIVLMFLAQNTYGYIFSNNIYVNNKILSQAVPLFKATGDYVFNGDYAHNGYFSIEAINNNYVYRIGYGYSDNTQGGVTFSLNTITPSNFKVIIYYNSLGVHGNAEGRVDSMGVISPNGMRINFFWSNYYSKGYNGVLSEYDNNNRVVKSTSGNTRLWNFFSKNKWYKIVFSKTGNTIKFEIFDNDTLIYSLHLDDTNIDGVSKIYVSTWQGRAYVDNIIVEGIILPPDYLIFRNIEVKNS